VGPTISAAAGLTVTRRPAEASPQTWIDPHRRPTRNTLHRHAREASRIGQQLRLALDNDG